MFKVDQVQVDDIEKNIGWAQSAADDGIHVERNRESVRIWKMALKQMHDDVAKQNAEAERVARGDQERAELLAEDAGSN